MKVKIRVQPRSSKEEIAQMGRGSYKVYMHEPARELKANKKLIEMLADYFATKKGNVRILSGLKARNKVVEIVQ